MQDVLLNSYLWLKAFHIIAMVAWMAGIFYLPRLFVYHCQAAPGGELDETLKLMERRLLRYIMTPAMLVTWLFGLLMLYANWGGIMEGQGWMHAKLLLVVLMSGVHGMLSKWRKGFEAGTNAKSESFYRWMNEVPTVLLIAIVILAVIKPF